MPNNKIKIIIVLIIVILAIPVVFLNNIIKINENFISNGYSGSTFSGSHYKETKTPDDVAIYANSSNIFDTNKFVVSFHYFESDNNQISLFSQINNKKIKSTSISINNGVTCPLTSDLSQIDISSEYYTFECDEYDKDFTGGNLENIQHAILLLQKEYNNML